MFTSSRVIKILGGILLLACLAVVVHREATAQGTVFKGGPNGKTFIGMPGFGSAPAIKNDFTGGNFPNFLFFGTSSQNAGGNNNGNNQGNNQGNNNGGNSGNNQGNNGGGNRGGGQSGNNQGNNGGFGGGGGNFGGGGGGQGGLPILPHQVFGYKGGSGIGGGFGGLGGGGFQGANAGGG